MNHYPYEEWLLEEKLTDDQGKQLKEHLTHCVDCRELRTALYETDQLLSNLPLAEPAEGFTDRWMNYANLKQEARQKSWVWLLLSGFVLSAAISLFVLQLPVILSGVSGSQMFASFFLYLIRTLENVYEFVRSFRFIFEVSTIRIPSYIWIGIGANVVFWISVWSFSLWRVVRPKGSLQ
jgi:hypothetical protein